MHPTTTEGVVVDIDRREMSTTTTEVNDDVRQHQRRSGLCITHHTYQYHINACSLTSRFCWLRAPRASCVCLICTSGNGKCVYYATAVPELWVFCLSFIMLLHIIILLLLLLLLLTVRLRFQQASWWLIWRWNAQYNPLSHLIVWKKVAYLRPKVGAIDRGEWGDQDALGLRFIRWMEGKICAIYYFWYATRVVHCGIIQQYT